ncbi:TPA: hypothetical protein ACX87D_002798 [Legionella pneumophila]
MLIEITKNQLESLVIKQLEALFFLGNEEKKIISNIMNYALERCEFCFSNTDNKYYKKNDQTYFNPYHSGQYTIFLYYLSNSLFEHLPNLTLLADRIYYLNKALNGLDLFYEVKMPAIFMLDHPVGSVLGRARYGDYFEFSQNCTVGNNKGVYPTIGNYVRMQSGAKIVGDCNIGNNVVLAANTYVKDTNIEDNSVVFGSSPNLIVKPISSINQF